MAGKRGAAISRQLHQDTHAYIQLVEGLHGFLDYQCVVCKKVYPFYDQALDCVLTHRLERLNAKAHKQHRNWSPRRY